MSRILVAFFSASGKTEHLAKQIAEKVNGDLYKINPAIPYSKADLNWMNRQSRSSIEMNNKDIRPALADHNANIEGYDTIMVGFPIWWYVAPTIINTFLQSYDFSKKKIILFATSGSSDFGNTLAELKPSVSQTALITEGFVTHRKISDSKLNTLLSNIGL